MSNAEPSSSEGPGAEPRGDGAGVFSGLPRTRPTVRSPRRAEPVRAEPEPEPDPEQSPLAGREEEIEALARASLSLAGGVATLGLKAAGRAAAAVRDVVERR